MPSFLKAFSSWFTVPLPTSNLTIIIHDSAHKGDLSNSSTFPLPLSRSPLTSTWLNQRVTSQSYGADCQQCLINLFETPCTLGLWNLIYPCFHPINSAFVPFPVSKHTQTLGDLVQSLNFKYRPYARDAHIYFSNPAPESKLIYLALSHHPFSSLLLCRLDISHLPRPKCNPWVSLPSLHLLTVHVNYIFLVAHMYTFFHSQSTSKLCLFHLWNASRIQPLLILSMNTTTVQATSSSYLHYCNSLLTGIPAPPLFPAAKMVLWKHKLDWTPPLHLRVKAKVLQSDQQSHGLDLITNSCSPPTALSCFFHSRHTGLHTLPGMHLAWFCLSFWQLLFLLPRMLFNHMPPDSLPHLKVKCKKTEKEEWKDSIVVRHSTEICWQ